MAQQSTQGERLKLQVKGKNIGWILAGVVALFIVIIQTDILAGFTTTHLLIGAGLVGAFFYLKPKPKKINVDEIIQSIVVREYTRHGNKINPLDVTWDILDSNTLGFSFESMGKLMTYKYNHAGGKIMNGVLSARLYKKLDAVKSEVSEREIMREIAAKRSEVDKEKIEVDEQGLEYGEEVR